MSKTVFSAESNHFNGFKEDFAMQLKKWMMFFAVLMLPGWAFAASDGGPKTAAVVTNVSDASVEELDATSNYLWFTVSFSGTYGAAILEVVTDSVSGFTATPNVDFARINTSAFDFKYKINGGAETQAGSNFITLPGNSVSMVEIGVKVYGDTICEIGGETVGLKVRGIGDLTFSDSLGVGTITESVRTDPVFMHITSTVNVTEKEFTDATGTFNVWLSRKSDATITVQYSTANGTAIASGDYTSLSATTLTFTANVDSAKTINVTVKGDTLDEGNETFTLNLSNNRNAALIAGDANPSTCGFSQTNPLPGTCTIIDNDPVLLWVANQSFNEGNADNQPAIQAQVEAPYEYPITVTYQTYTKSGDTYPATAGTDYVAVSSGSFTVSANTTSAVVPVTFKGDLMYEKNETFYIHLLSWTPNNVSAVRTSAHPDSDTVAVITITNDDAAPKIYVSDVRQFEGDSEIQDEMFSFNVWLSNPSYTSISGTFSAVEFADCPGTSGAAQDGGKPVSTACIDFSDTTQALTFASGETMKTVEVRTYGDLFIEPDDSFYVYVTSVTSADSAVKADTMGVGVLINGDKDSDGDGVNDSIDDCPCRYNPGNPNPSIYSTTYFGSAIRHQINRDAPSDTSGDYCDNDIDGDGSANNSDIANQGNTYMNYMDWTPFGDALGMDTTVTTAFRGRRLQGFASPLFTDNQTIAEVFDEIVEPVILTKTSFGITEQMLQSDTLAPGYGYFYRPPLSSSGTLVGFTGKKMYNPFYLPVSPYWDGVMVGNPYVWDIAPSWIFASKRDCFDKTTCGNVACFGKTNEFTIVYIYQDGRARVNPSPISTGMGGYVYTTGDWISVFPSDPTPVSGLPTTREADDPSAWELQLSASAGDLLDTDNWIGVSGAANDGYDLRYDYPEIAMPEAEFVRIAFPHYEWTEKNHALYTKDTRSPFSGTRVWNMEVEVSSAAQTVDLTWPTLNALPADAQVKLVDLQTNRTINLRQAKKYSFDHIPTGSVATVSEMDLAAQANRGTMMVTKDAERLGTIYYFQVVVTMGQETEGETAGNGWTYRLSQNNPNPFSPTTTIRYQLPTAQRVSLQVFNAAGQLVKTLVNGEKEAGDHSISWDGANDTNQAVSSGVYFYRLQAGSFVQTNRMILMR